MKIVLAAGAALAMALGPGAAATAATTLCSAKLCDAVRITDGSTTLTFTARDESHEFFKSLEVLPTPSGWKDEEIILTEGPGGPVSDRLLMLTDPATNHLNVYFISDDASAAKQAKFDAAEAKFAGVPVTLVETGKFQPVGTAFGQSKGFARILSDVDVPEPASWALMLVGFGGLDAMLRMRRQSPRPS
jgi:hypothetical protein